MFSKSTRLIERPWFDSGGSLAGDSPLDTTLSFQKLLAGFLLSPICRRNEVVLTYMHNTKYQNCKYNIKYNRPQETSIRVLSKCPRVFYFNSEVCLLQKSLKHVHCSIIYVCVCAHMHKSASMPLTQGGGERNKTNKHWVGGRVSAYFWGN